MMDVFALVDCNSFYASCEKVFNPSLKDKLIAVLSNNDGIIIARSKEVKELGIPMGQPVFKIKHLIKKYNVKLFSSNYTLYADLSKRVMETLKTFSPQVEVYSIDEAFVIFPLNTVENISLREYGLKIKKTVEKWTGIPVSVGIGPSKTLAKLANRLAKKKPELEGVYSLVNHENIDRILDNVDVSDLWGIGRQYAKLLRNAGIRTARQLKEAPDQWVREYMTVVGLRLVHELRGIPCYEVELEVDPKKGIVSSRSFGKLTSDYNEIRESVASYTARAAEKLRAQKSVTSFITVFITTNPYKKEMPQYGNVMTCAFKAPTADSSIMIKQACSIFEKIYKPGYLYKKSGIMLTGITHEDDVQYDAFTKAYVETEGRTVMDIIDKINNEYGRDTIQLASMGAEKKWSMKRGQLSPRYTTSWNELPKTRNK